MLGNFIDFLEGIKVKIFGKVSAVLVSVFCLTARAEPVMTLITVNTPDPAGYAAWARSNAEDISKANGAVAMGYAHRPQVRSRSVITTSGPSFHLSKRSGVVIR